MANEMIRAGAENPFGALLFAGRNGEYMPLPLGPAKVETHDGSVSRRYEIRERAHRLSEPQSRYIADAGYADLDFEVDLQPFEMTRTGRDRAARRQRRTTVARWRGIQLPGSAGYSSGRRRRPDSRRCTSRIFRPDARPRRHDRQPRRDAHAAGRNFSGCIYGLRTETRDEGTQTLARTEPRGSNVQTFRFRIAVQQERRRRWERFGQELNLPLQSSVVTSPKLPIEESFLGVNSPSVHIAAFKAAEASPGWYVMRLQEIGGHNVSGVSVSFEFSISVDSVFASTCGSAHSAISRYGKAHQDSPVADG